MEGRTVTSITGFSNSSHDSHRATLDVATAAIDVRLVGADAPPSTWTPDDLNRRFRHTGSKVADVNSVVARA